MPRLKLFHTRLNRNLHLLNLFHLNLWRKKMLLKKVLLVMRVLLKQNLLLLKSLLHLKNLLLLNL